MGLKGRRPHKKVSTRRAERVARTAALQPEAATLAVIKAGSEGARERFLKAWGVTLGRRADAPPPKRRPIRGKGRPPESSA